VCFTVVRVVKYVLRIPKTGTVTGELVICSSNQG